MNLGAHQANCKKYGVPLYGAYFIPRSALRSSSDAESESESVPGDESDNYLIFAGGGGKGRSGIPNALVISHFDTDTNSLSDQPVEKLGTDDLPYRMAVHPGGGGVICSLPRSCRWYEWDATKSNDVFKLSLKSSEKVLDQLEDVGQQLAITFSHDGSLLALGSEDGKLRAFKWPSMESILDVPDAHTSVKNLDFSPDGKFLVSVGSGGPGRVWDMSSSMAKASLTKETDEVFGFCGFSQNSEKDQILYVTAMQDRGGSGSIVKWNTTSWKRISSKLVVRDPISAFNVSPDGKSLAVGTIEGDILILNSSSMRVQTIVKKAHLGLVTAVAFSQDSRALASASFDSSARVTLIKQAKTNGMSVWVMLSSFYLLRLYIMLKPKVFFLRISTCLPAKRHKNLHTHSAVDKMLSFG